MSIINRPRPVVLCILDGWGFREDAIDNAITQAKAPVFRKYWESSPHSLLEASEEYVGLPKGQIGNSEVGHMNLGAGRVIFQDLPLIDRAISSGEFDSNLELNNFISNLNKSTKTCHLLGLVSSGGVHSHQDHILHLAKVLSLSGIQVLIHAFLDGRDVPPKSALEQINKFQQELKKIKNTKIVTLCGRYFAMDRDNRWDRVEKAYNLITLGSGSSFSDPISAIKSSYSKDVNDEFLQPASIDNYQGMTNGDGLIFANFRADRAREILLALLDSNFLGFARKTTIKFSAALGMVEYSDHLKLLMPSMFPPKQIKGGLGELISRIGLKQLRIAETEKYPHVTFFFNGGREEAYVGEDRIMIPSPKVPTYDLQPEMSADLLTNQVIESIESDKYDLIVLNYANPDMVGHTGILEAAKKAVEALDVCLGKLFASIEKVGGILLLTADHGNCERMIDPNTGGPHTAHTLEKVPLVIINPPKTLRKLRDGKLSDVAPTLLELMDIPLSPEMEGKSLIIK